MNNRNSNTPSYHEKALAHDSVLTSSGMDRLVEYIDYFQNSENDFYQNTNGYFLESEEVARFRKTLDETGFLLVFNWIAWINQHELYKDLENHIDDQLMNSDLETLRKLMTSYIRGDRFNEGLFLKAVVTGKVGIILERLKELKNTID